MRWNYRLVRDGDEFSVREVYYDGDDVVGWTYPIGLVGDSLGDIQETLGVIAQDIVNRPLLDITGRSHDTDSTSDSTGQTSSC